jgi:hypothetical protein
MTKLSLLALCFSSIVLFFNCTPTKSPPPPTGDQLGELHFKFNGSEAAMPYFEKGLKLLHNFEYDNACTEFKKAQELDSSFVMAFWGEAMTYNHPLWRQQDYEKGQEALNKLSESAEERAAMAKTDLEKDFLQSVEIMYGSDGNKKLRDSLYSARLEKMYSQYQGDHEVAAFYALSLLGAVKVGRDEAAYEKGAQIAQGILKENPNHPGALHYLIHSYDDPKHAPKALPAAFSYSKVAADATHALHMPSHIFVAVGMWNEVIKSNIASWEASVAAAEADSTAKNFGSYHALHWLMYGHLQKGHFAEAKQIMLDMKKYADEKPTEGARDYLISMKGNYLVETDEWEGEIADFTCDLEDMGLVIRATDHWIEGRKAYQREDTKSLKSIIQQMQEEREKAAEKVTKSGIPMCSAAGSSRNMVNQLDIDQAHVMELQLTGLLADLEGDEKMVEKWYSQAATQQMEMSSSYGPPVISKPTFELYGEWLLNHGNAELAIQQFDNSLLKGPKRMRALTGKLKAAKMLKNETMIKEVEAELAQVMIPIPDESI